jgi:hypothetical protein
MDDFHSRRSQDAGPFRPSELFGQDAPPQSVVLDKVMSMHAQLPSRFKETRPVLSETEDRLSFQAANIAATLQVHSSLLLVYDLGQSILSCSLCAWYYSQQKTPLLTRSARLLATSWIGLLKYLCCS